PKTAQFLGEVRAIGCDHTSFTGREMLHRVEAEGGHVSDRSDWASAEFGPESVAGILDDDQPVAVSQIQNGVVIGWVPGIVNRYDHASVPADSPGDLIGIDIQRVAADIGEDRGGALIQDAVRGCGKRHWRSDRLVTRLKTGGKCGSVQGSRSGTEADGVLRTDVSGKGLFEFRYFRASRQPIRAQHIDDALDVFLADGLARIGQHRAAHRRATVDSQLPALDRDCHRLCHSPGRERQRFGRSDEFLQVRGSQPLLVSVAGIPKTLGYGLRLGPVLHVPPGMVRANYVHVGRFDRLTSFVLGNQGLVQLLSGANADEFHVAIRRNRGGHIQYLHAGDLRNKDFAAVHGLDAADNEIHPLFEGDPEARHPRIRNRYAPPLALFLKNRNHAPPATHHVSVARAAEARVLCTRIGVRLYEHFFGAQFGRAVKIDWVDGLIRA